MNQITYICLPSCITCRKGKAWLSEKNLDFVYRHIEKERLSPQELKEIAARKKIPVTGLVNPKSRNLREMGISLADLSEEKALEILTKNPKIMYRPVVLAGDKVLLGFKESEFAALLE